MITLCIWKHCQITLRYLANQFICATKRDISQLITVYIRATNIHMSILFNDYTEINISMLSYQKLRFLQNDA